MIFETRPSELINGITKQDVRAEILNTIHLGAVLFVSIR